MMLLNGIIPAMSTPFDDGGSVALDRMRGNIVRYNAIGLSGYLVAGSTGETAFLDRTEFEQILGVVRESAAAGKILIAGTGVDSAAETLSRTEFAAKAGYDFALVLPPCFFKPMMKAEVLVEHYRRVAEAARIPVLLYSVPQFTGMALGADVVARLAEHPNIAGMKDSSGNVDRLGEILASVPERFQVMTGASSIVLPTMALGASGAILGLADFLPEACVALYDAITAKDDARALELQRRLIPASRKIVADMGIAGIKYAMDCRGYYGGPVRRPLLPLAETQKREVESLLCAFAPAGVNAKV